VRERLQARKEAPEPPAGAQVGPASEPLGETLQEVIRFAKAATSKDDVDRAAQIATHLEDELEIEIAQEQLDAARKRVG
jgi:hypothetical protein